VLSAFGATPAKSIEDDQTCCMAFSPMTIAAISSLRAQLEISRPARSWEFVDATTPSPHQT
jgi:hypothetical protein